MAEAATDQSEPGGVRPVGRGDELAEHIRQQLDDFRHKLLDPSLRNPLLSFTQREPSTAFVRVVDELPDAVFEELESGSEFIICPLDPPRTEPEDEETEPFLEALAKLKAEDPVYLESAESLKRRRAGRNATAELERRARDRVRFQLGMAPWEPEARLPPEELARRRGLDPDYDLPERDPDMVLERHQDNKLQTLLLPDRLDPTLRGLRERARSSVREMGITTLFAAFGFLEWYEDDTSERPHFAPLVLVPLEINRRREGQRYRYIVAALDQKPQANRTLDLVLRERFGLVLPPFEDDDTPETYFHKVRVMCDEKQAWQVRRFLTLGVFPFSKMAIYEDLDLNAGWASPDAVVGHGSIRKLVASAGDADSPFGEEYPLDDPEIEATLPPLIYDADSSQHSAIIDVREGQDLAIHGPPGTGKSQTITNIIGATLAAGKSVLFVAEKMAALDVVSDRLNKAGLGTFCLKLHRNVKKAAVLSEFKQRLEMAAPTFDATRYEQDKARWRAERDALRDYAELVHETVGGLGLTVHDVLWHAIEAQSWIDRLPATLRTVILPEAVRLDPHRVHVARGSLAALEKRFGEAIESVVDLATHPWRGARRQGLTPIDIATATDQASTWRQALLDLDAKVADVLGASVEPRAFGALRDVIRRLLELAAPPRPDWFDHHKEGARSDFRRAVLAFAEGVARADEIAEALAAAFAPEAVAGLTVEDLNAIAAVAVALGIEETPRDAIAEQRSAARWQAKEWNALHGGFERLLALFGIEDRSASAVSAALDGAKRIGEADRSVLLARTDALVEESNGVLLRGAATQFRILREQGEELAAQYHMASIPEAGMLRRHASALREGGLMRAFDRDFKEARRSFKAISKSPAKLKPDQMAAEFDRLTSYRETESEIHQNERLSTIMAPTPIGVGTDFDLALSINGWATKIVQAFPGLDPVRRHIRHVTLHGEISVIDEIRTVYAEIDSLTPGVTAVEEGLSCEDVETRLAAETERAERLHAVLERIEAVGFEPARRIVELQALGERVAERDEIVHRLDECDEAKKWFGDDFAGAATDFSPHAEDIAYLRGIERVGLSDALCEAVFARASTYPGGIDEMKRDLGSALDRAAETWRALVETVGIDETDFFVPSAIESMSLGELADRGSHCAASGPALSTWHAFQLARSAALATPGRAIVEVFERSKLAQRDLVRAFDFILYRALGNEVYHAHPDLQRLSGLQLQNSRAALAGVDQKLLELERTRIARELCLRRVEAGVGIGRPRDFTERALIQYQVSLQRSPLPLRDLLLRAGTAARQLKPCFMMSPVTVAQYLPQISELFDLVVIDEASQMRPEDAFGAIARAKQCIIVGDPMQLPPTSFFETAFWTQTDEDDAEDRLYEQVDSILDLGLRAYRPTRYLRWHYRSLHSGLIRFSNHHFYDDRLIVFPAANEDDPEHGVRLEAVEGVYQGRRNAIEARAVVDAALAFMKSPRTRNFSLGVVAINQTQRDLLAEMFDHAFANDTRADGYRGKWEGTLYPFFVKNLESVQGDERDAIFISMVYGPDADSGRVANRFGPINKPGGHRRLNVLFTRARRQVRVFSSMKASDVRHSERQSEGVGILRAYLEYAATGRLHAGEIDPEAATGSPFEDFVKSRIEIHGYEAVPQVGVAGYRIDLGVRHPDYPNGFILGVECDGAAYHSAITVRDRDRLRQMILEGLGWEIYRIWSTDWFADSDREMEKLLSHLETRIAPVRPETEPPHEPVPYTATARAIALPGIVLDTPTQEVLPIVDQTASVEGLTQPEALAPEEHEAPVAGAGDVREMVEIGDLVEWARAGENGTIKQVQIVNGPDDSERGIINDGKPLAIALLGCSVGERTTVEQPTSTIEVVVMRIIKGIDSRVPTEPAQTATHGAATQEDGLGAKSSLAPYTVWEGRRLPDPRNGDPRAVSKSLCEIIEVEGPVLVARTFRLYARACRLQRVGRHVQTSLAGALSRLVKDNRVIIENENRQPGQLHGTARVLGKDRVLLRERGPRSFDEIPPSEIATHLRAIREDLIDPTEEELGRELLDRYGLVRMTQAVRATLTRLYREHL